MQDCLFCKIIGGEIPSTRVFENEHVYAFLDINPQAPTHILVIPKQHIASAAEITPENSRLAAKCLEAIPEIARDAGLSDGYRIISNVGKSAGQTVFHLHFHLLGGKPLGEKLL